MERKSIMTLDEHREMGKNLQDARNMLISNSVKLANLYGETKELSLKLEKAASLIDEVRFLLEGKLFKEHPDLKNDDGLKYY